MNRIKRSQLEILDADAVTKEDARMFCRFALNDVGVQFKDLNAGEEGVALCKDISGSGAGIETSRDIRPKTSLEMRFDFKDGFQPLCLLGSVMWSRPTGRSWRLGVAFDQPHLMGLSRILKFEIQESERGEK